jgi:putative ABC transport system substrate-binding protein
MNPKLFWLITAILLASIHSAQAQQAKTIRIGFLTGSTSSNVNTNVIDPFRQGLRDLGYIEGKNFTIEYRAADGKFEQMPKLVAELIGLGVSVIVTSGMPAVIAAKKATSTIPIVTANAEFSRGWRYHESRPSGWERHRIDESRCGL